MWYWMTRSRNWEQISGENMMVSYDGEDFWEEAFSKELTKKGRVRWGMGYETTPDDH
jgi:hypothetical protein